MPTSGNTRKFCRCRKQGMDVMKVIVGEDFDLFFCFFDKKILEGDLFNGMLDFLFGYQNQSFVDIFLLSGIVTGCCISFIVLDLFPIRRISVRLIFF